ncbi:uncharacterized protein LOC117105582 [Anneissia japonica]|uniref:uncharacterized protein LOC117105582 n=1 Tax=Anneissia japonica TaxID=1529436 RepID=UPI001425837B|nr:uncharacterized protein LOC117105582 [Anneissia japonica]
MRIILKRKSRNKITFTYLNSTKGTLKVGQERRLLELTCKPNRCTRSQLKNKLFQAIDRKDWQAVRRICETEEHLINTYDDDALHGRTPLHHCLSHPGMNYDKHRETAMCLMMHGASMSIQNKLGMTPLDNYNDNECSEYGTKRIKKKQSLRKLLIELSVPGEIKARGEAAVKAFKYEMQNGKMTVINARFMFMGKEGAGKTSCVNHILGKAFNEDEESTDGIVTTTVFQTFCEDCSVWKKTDVDVAELTNQIKEGAIAENIAKKLKQPESQRSTPPTSSSLVKVEEATSVMTLSKRGNSQNPQGAGGLSTNQSMGSYDTVEKKLQNRLHELLVNRLANEGPSNVGGPSEVTSIWDYAGQLKYYITHRIYLTGGASYGVVFSLLDELNDFVKSRDVHKGKFSMTNLEMILFWMRSIFEHAVLPNVEKKTIFFNDTKISSPPISLIATHKDQLSKSEAETRIKTMYQTIFDAIKDTAYETHVDRTIYAVDNTAKMDEGIEKLKKNVMDYMKAMARTVPTNWVDFQSKVQELAKTKLRVSLEEITSVAAECGIAKDTIITVLDYLNDTGIILYSKTNEKLKNTVITNLHMMIDFLTKIITVVKPDDIDKWPKMMPMWNKLDEEGILEEELLRHLWRHEIEKDASNFDVFLELMMMFRLLFELRKDHRTENQGPRKIEEKGDQQFTRRFIVPSRMQVNKESLEVKKDEKQTVSVYVTPTDFLPDAVYNILVVAFLDLMKVKGKSSEAELYQNCSDFDLDDDHLLEISHLIDQDGNVVAEPHPSFCIEILDYLRDQLKTVYGTTEGIGYKLRVLCSVCQPTQKPHLHDLEDCLKKKVRCGRKAMNTSRLKRLFSAGGASSLLEDPETSLKQSSESNDASSKNLQPVPPKKGYSDRLISEYELNEFSGKLGAEWKSFVRSLGLKENEIFHACPVYSPEREKIFCCLRKWRDREAGNATVKALVKKCIEHKIDVDVYEFLLE